MTKNEFVVRLEQEKLQTGDYIIVIDELNDSPLIIGCVFHEDIWKIYKTKEHGGHYVIREFNNENDTYDYFYDFIYNLHKRITE